MPKPISPTELPNLDPPTHEETLDPQDWDALHQLGHRMVDDMLDYLRGIGERPVWRPIPEETKAEFQQPLPTEPGEPAAIYEDFQRHILPYPKGNIHPRFWSWVQGTGTPMTALAELLAATMNSNAAIGDHSAMYVERQVLNWCKELLGFPLTAGGHLTTGATMANLTALLAARHHARPTVREDGLAGAPQLTVYASTETHSCIPRAVEVMGLGRAGLRLVPVDEHYRIDLAALRALIAEDRAAGRQPFCVVGNAGTVNTGAVDDLAGLREICTTEKLWFHVDGAFGALAKLTPEFEPALQAIEQADSVAFDLHKWIYLPYDIGCVLIRDAAAHRATFAGQPSYLLSHERGLAGGPDPVANYGIELSRGFRALKVWIHLREHGRDRLARLIRQNIAQAHYLGRLITAHDELELLAPVTMNIVCFRHRFPGADPETTNALNKEILMQLHERGIAAPSYTLLQGRYAIRVANVNHRSRREDFDALVEGVLVIGGEVGKE